MCWGVVWYVWGTELICATYGWQQSFCRLLEFFFWSAYISCWTFAVGAIHLFFIISELLQAFVVNKNKWIQRYVWAQAFLCTIHIVFFLHNQFCLVKQATSLKGRCLYSLMPFKELHTFVVMLTVPKMPTSLETVFVNLGNT